ncbi:Imm1 family immunity protein [Streptomyces sp. CA2R106]|uniref:Imm1 family immunity protein n=1 Tax=Streptomyces sp. CA2R106 TaxID=3120153 RepID=UPI00300BB6B7
MILNAIIHGRYRYAESRAEMGSLVMEVTEGLRSERLDTPWISAGENAFFMFADRRHSENVRDWWPDNTLQISTNPTTGYGGLIWFATQDRVSRDEISEYIWISDGEVAPNFDPRVVADPGIPRFFDPRSTLPISKIRIAIEEFCHRGTGDRPECIRWVKGEMDGRRCE